MSSILGRRDDLAEALALVMPSARKPAVDHRALVRKAREIASKIAAPNAVDVDEKGRFPAEAFEALKRERLLGLMIPGSLGGEGVGIATVSEICSVLSQACASTGMIYAMHLIKTSSLTQHCLDSDFHRSFMRRCADEQLLLASATTEGGGVGGDMRVSICGVQRDGGMFDLAKEGCVISYGAQADAILITARRTPDAPASDQVMAVMTREQYSLEKTGAWNTMGMRGTCSDSFVFAGRAPVEQIIPTAFAEISAQSMLPYAHLLWASVWHGIACDAVARSEAFFRAEARKRPGATPPGALRLAELLTMQQRLKAVVVAGVDRYERAKDDEDELTSIGFVVAMNSVKISASQAVGEIVTAAFMICGILGYRNDSPYSLSRAMRDALSAPVMINNDRILGNVSNLLAVYKHDASLLR